MNNQTPTPAEWFALTEEVRRAIAAEEARQAEVEAMAAMDPVK